MKWSFWIFPQIWFPVFTLGIQTFWKFLNTLLNLINIPTNNLLPRNYLNFIHVPYNASVWLYFDVAKFYIQWKSFCFFCWILHTLPKHWMTNENFSRLFYYWWRELTATKIHPPISLKPFWFIEWLVWYLTWGAIRWCKIEQFEQHSNAETPNGYKTQIFLFYVLPFRHYFRYSTQIA